MKKRSQTTRKNKQCQKLRGLLQQCRRRRRRRWQRERRRSSRKNSTCPQLPGSFASFCVRCRHVSPTFNRSTVILRNGSSALRGNCTICHAVKFRFMSHQEFMSRIIASTITVITFLMRAVVTPA